MADNSRRVSQTVLIGDGLLLLCALPGLAGSFLSLYGSYGLPGATALARCAADGDLILICAALFGLATLAVWSPPRLRGGLAAGLTAVWLGCILWNWTEVVQGAGITVRDIAALFASRVSWGQTFPFETDLLPGQEAGAVQLFLLLALAGLALLMGWAVVRSRRWWVVMLLTLPPLLPGLLADLYPDWLPFMMLAACWCTMLLTSLCRYAAADRRGKLTLTVLPAVALVLALITAIFPREGYTRPAWARKAEDNLRNLTSHLADYFSHWDGPFRSTVTYVGAAEEADLVHAGPLSFTGRTVLRVTSDYGGWMYLRGSSLAVYEDGVWKTLPDGAYEAYWSGQEPEVSPLYLPSTLEQDSPVHTVTVDNVGAVGVCVYTPYFLLPQDAAESGMLPVEDAYFARRQGLRTHVMTFVERSPTDLVTWVGSSVIYSAPDDANPDVPEDLWESALSVYVANVVETRAAALAYTRYAYANYLDVPEELREILEEHARNAALPLLAVSYRPPNYNVLMAEQFGSYLESFCQYDAGAPAAPDGVDPLYYFLEESHRGYCMHYASAVTLMLRTMGIPARYVSGFKAEITPGRRTDIPDRAAHAWVEVWVDGFGWYPVEVTPAAAFDWAQPGAQNTDNPVEDTPEPTPTPTAAPEPTESPDLPTESLPVGEGNVDGPEKNDSGPDLSVLLNVLKVAAPMIVALFAAWSVQFFAKRFRARRMAGPDPNRSALVCYGYLCRLERRGGKMDARAVELAQKARFSQHTLTEEELGLLRELVDRERERLCAASGLPRRLLRRYWWGMPPKQKE